MNRLFKNSEFVITLAYIPHAAAEETLLRRIARRDPAAVSELYDRQSIALYALILRIVGDEGDADDVLQGVFLGVCERASSHNAELSPATVWLMRIARDLAIDRVRLKVTKARGKEDDSESAQKEDVQSGTRPNSEQVHSQQEREMAEALTQLPRAERELIEHAFFCGYTQSQLAEHFRLPLGTIKTRIRSGMSTLKDSTAAFDAERNATMNSQYLNELAALNALGALDGEDLIEFKRLAPNVSPEARKEIAVYEEVAVLIASAGEQKTVPRAKLKEQLMKRIHELFLKETCV